METAHIPEQSTQISVYQISPERDRNNVLYIGFQSLEICQGSNQVDSRIYDRVYTGNVNCKDLEDVFALFNQGRTPDFYGRSLSVSDVIVVEQSTCMETGAYFCDNIGFRKIHFAQELAMDQMPDISPDRNADSREEAQLVVIAEPGKKAVCQKMPLDLASLQNAVDGYIEAIYPYDDPVAILVNEEGWMRGLPMNRVLLDTESSSPDIIAGTMVITGLGEDNFCGLSQELAQKYAELYRDPQFFISRNGTIIPIVLHSEEITLEKRVTQAREQAREQRKTSPAPGKDQKKTR